MARSTLARHRNLWHRDPNEGGGGGSTGGSGEGGGTDGGANGGGNSDNGGNGGNRNTGEKLFTQAELDQKIGERLNRQKSQFADYDQLKADSEELTRLRKETESATEKAVREAREQAAAEERARVAPQAVRAEFKAAAKGVLTDAQRDAFLEDADLTKYLTDKGEVDVDKVAKKVEALAPAKPEKEKPRAPRDTGQGNRSEGGKTSVSSAREDYLERRRKQTASA